MSTQKPFDLTAALAGKQVVNGYGELVTITRLTQTRDSGQVLLSQLASDGRVRAYHYEDGSVKHIPGYTLYMAPTTVTKWINIYPVPPTCFSMFASEVVADHYHSFMLNKRLGNKAHPISYEE